MSYILTAWTDEAEMTVRTKEPRIIVQRAEELALHGWRLSIVDTATGDTLTNTEIADRADALEVSKATDGALGTLSVRDRFPPPS